MGSAANTFLCILSNWARKSHLTTTDFTNALFQQCLHILQYFKGRSEWKGRLYKRTNGAEDSSQADIHKMVVFRQTSKLSVHCSHSGWLRSAFADADWLIINVCLRYFTCCVCGRPVVTAPVFPYVSQSRPNETPETPRPIWRMDGHMYIKNFQKEQYLVIYVIVTHPPLKSASRSRRPAGLGWLTFDSNKARRTDYSQLYSTAKHASRSPR